MDSFSAFFRGEAARAAGAKMKVFDWNKAAKILKERRPREAVAGLLSDMGCTAGVIFRDGAPVLTEYTYLASVWATPILELDGEEIECWCCEDETEWDAETKWPESALALLVQP